jgi:hypothetical protein
MKLTWGLVGVDKRVQRVDIGRSSDYTKTESSLSSLIFRARGTATAVFYGECETAARMAEARYSRGWSG